MTDSPPRHRGGLQALATIPLALHAFLAWRLRAPAISTGQDDAVYLLLGRGLRDLGYSNYWLIGNPPHGTYPPLYPLILGGTDAVFGHAIGPAVVLSILCSTVALAFLFGMTHRWSPPAAFLALSVSAVNPWLVRLAGKMFSEPLYMLCVALTLWCLSLPASSVRSRLGAGLMAVASFLGRIIGVTMVFAVFLHWLIERRYRSAAIFGAVSLVVVGGWFVRARVAASATGTGQSYISDALSTRTGPVPEPDSVPAAAPAHAGSAVQGLPVTSADTAGFSGARSTVRSIPALATVVVKRILFNGPAYLSRRIPTVLAFPTIPGTTLDNWFWLALIVVLGGVGLVHLYRRLPAAALYLGGYAAILLVWPFSLLRYLAPVIPLLLITLFLGLSRLAGRRAGLVTWVAPSVLGLVLVMSGLGEQRSELSASGRCDRAAPYTSEGCFTPVERAFFEAVRYGDSLVPRDSVILSPKMATVYYLTGRRSIDELEVTHLESDALRAYLRERRVNYVLLSRIHLDQRWIAESLQYSCGDWELVRDFGGEALLLRRVAERPRDPALPACEAMMRFAKGRW